MITSKLFSYLGVIAATLIVVFGVPKLLSFRPSLKADAGDIYLADTAKALPSEVAQVADTAKALPRGNGSTAKSGSNGQITKSTVITTGSDEEPEVLPGIIESTATPEPVPSASPPPPLPTPWPQTPTPVPTPTIEPTPSPTPLPSPTPEETPTPLPEPTPTPARVVINEVAWMGTGKSSADEWIELFNPGDEDVDLSGWTLTAADGTPNIVLSGNIVAGGYFLLERTDDTTISDIPANIIYTGGLSNGGEVLELRDASGFVIDVVGSGAWYNEDEEISRKQDIPSMERILAEDSGTNSSNWLSNDGTVTVGSDADRNPIKGTPGYKNSVSP